MNSSYKIVDDKVIFLNSSMFNLLKPIAYGSTSDIYKARIGTEMWQ